MYRQFHMGWKAYIQRDGTHELARSAPLINAYKLERNSGIKDARRCETIVLLTC